MYEDPKEKKSLIQEQIVDAEYSARKVVSFSDFFNKIHSFSALYLLSAVLQIFLGLSVVALSMAGFIEPRIIAVSMAIIGSVTTMVGLYFAYHLSTQSNSFNSLLNRAIKRVINSQN